MVDRQRREPDARGGFRMTAEEAIIRELSTGPKTLNHLSAKCAPEGGWSRWPSQRLDGILALMVSRGDVGVREWVVDRGRFVPVYYLRRKRE